MRRLPLCVAIGCLPLAASAGGFVPLDLPGSQLAAISHDGCVASGSALGATSAAFRWRADTGAVLLDGAIAVGGLSPSGRFVAGSVLDDMQRQVAAYWDAAGVAHRIASMHGIETIGSVSQGLAVSDEPRVVGSARRPGRGSIAFEWTQAGGMRALPGSDDAASARALAVSVDGRRIAGAQRSGDGARALLWQEGRLLPSPSPALDDLLGASHDARVLLGVDGRQPVAWHWHDTAVAPLPSAAIDAASDVRLLASSDDGRVRVGGGEQGTQRVPMLWRNDLGYIALDALLERHAIPVPADWQPQLLTAVSGDGLRLGGWGTRADGRIDSFLVDLDDAPRACATHATAAAP